MSPSVYQDTPSTAFLAVFFFLSPETFKKKGIINDAEKDYYQWSLPLYGDLARLHREESD